MPEKPVSVEDIRRGFRQLEVRGDEIHQIEPNAATLQKMKLVEDRFMGLAETILTNVPESSFRTIALGQIFAAKTLSLESIARGGII
jgi:hypothetical protein